MRPAVRVALVSAFLISLVGCAQPDESGTPIWQPIQDPNTANGHAPVSGSPTEPAAGTSTDAKLKWQEAIPAAAKGLAVHSNSGDVFVAVDRYATGTFEKTGGLITLDPQGKRKSALPLGDSFKPGSPLISSNGAHLFSGAAAWNVFHLDIAKNKVGPLTPEGNVDPRDLGLMIDASSALSPDGRTLYVPGRKLYTLKAPDTEPQASGDKLKVTQAVDLGLPIRQLVRMEGETFLLNLTADTDSDGTIAKWKAGAPAPRKLLLEVPIRALAAREDWTVGIVKYLDRCAVVQLNVEDNSGYPYVEITALALFQAVSNTSMPSNCGNLTVAVHPFARQVVVVGGAPLLRSGDNPAPNELKMGIWFNFTTRTFLKLDVNAATGAAFSPDGKTVYVTDQAGVKAFTAP